MTEKTLTQKIDEVFTKEFCEKHGMKRYKVVCKNNVKVEVLEFEGEKYIYTDDMLRVEMDEMFQLMVICHPAEILAEKVVKLLEEEEAKNVHS